MTRLLSILVSVLWISAKAGPVVFPGYDAEVIQWNKNINANSGSAKPSTRLAATAWFRDVRTAGLRSKIVRANLMCGNNIASATYCVIYDKGNAFNDINHNGAFNSGNYFESGTGGGISGDAATSKYLQTKLVPSTDLTSIGDVHYSYYVTGPIVETTVIMGCQNASSLTRTMYSYANYTGVGSIAVIGAQSVAANYALDATDTVATGGYYVGSRVSSSSLKLYKNAVNTASAATPTGNLPDTTDGFYIFAFADNTTPSAPTNRTLGGYTIGAGLSASDIAIMYLAFQRFETALARQK